MTTTFIPYVGFGKIKFGMTVGQVQSLLGKPTEITENEQFGPDPDDLVTTLYYENLGLSLSFDKVQDFRLTDIMTDGDCSIEFEGIRVGMPKKDVFAIIEKADLGPFEETDTEEEAFDEGNDEELTSYDLLECGVSLWFKGEELDTIQLSPEFDDDDNVVWPK